MQDTGLKDAVLERIREIERLEWDFFRPGKAVRRILPEEFTPLCMLLAQHFQSFIPPEFEKRKSEVKGSLLYKKNPVIVCFSGGLKSIATAFFYIGRGYDVILFHVYHTKIDYEAVREMADMMSGTKLIVDDGRINWNTTFRNIGIINHSIMYALDEGLPCNIAVGSYSNVSINNNDFHEYGAECNETFRAYEKIINGVAEDFKVRQPLPQSSYMWDEVLRHKRYLDLATTDKDILYIVRADLDHSIDIDMKQYRTRMTRLKKKLGTDSTEELYRRCFPQDIRQSRVYESLR